MLRLDDLDAVTRRSMHAEFLHDQARGRIYLPSRLDAVGTEAFPLLLEASIESGDDETLAAAIRGGGFLKSHEWHRTKTGARLRRVPVNAAETIAEEEFNRYYVRGVCLRALDEGLTAVEVYRAKPVRDARPESEGKLSFLIQPERLLADLRARDGSHPSTLGIPAGPNSGISIRRPRAAAMPQPSIWARAAAFENA